MLYLDDFSIIVSCFTQDRTIVFLILYSTFFHVLFMHLLSIYEIKEFTKNSNFSLPSPVGYHKWGSRLRDFH